MEFLKAAGKYVYEGNTPILLRGFGLGGWFLPEGYMWKLYSKCDRPRKMEELIERLCGKAYAEQFWQQYLDSYITKADIELIAKEGFNSVRLPINARHLYKEKVKDCKFVEMIEGPSEESSLGSLEGTCETTSEYVITDMINRIDQLIAWCREYNIYVILDMHGAPGGQTGQNIDDSEKDLPELFIEEHYANELSFLWKELAKRYKNEPVVAGYDLLNEPVPNFFKEYNDKVLPLYRRLIREIREIDPKHMIILEGVHWATDFTILEDFTKEEAADNILLQFHKYWNNPDAESLNHYREVAARLDIPLFMGEGGENNCDWYTTAFPMFEQQEISWSFWTYKKMDCTNSPITFDEPEGWDKLMESINGEYELEQELAIGIFDRFLTCIRSPRVNSKVFRALKREVPVRIPCEAYQEYKITSERIKGAELRNTELVSIMFANGKTGDVDYFQNAGQEHPEEENLIIVLSAGDKTGYQFISTQENITVSICVEGEGELELILNEQKEIHVVSGNSILTVRLACQSKQKQYIWLSCRKGSIRADWIELS